MHKGSLTQKTLIMNENAPPSRSVDPETIWMTVVPARLIKLYITYICINIRKLIWGSCFTRYCFRKIPNLEI
jgi:hypothetical protein